MDDIFWSTKNYILTEDPEMDVEPSMIRRSVAQCQNSNVYQFTKEESLLINRCKKKRDKTIVYIVTVGGAVSILGSIFSVSRRVFLQNVLLVTAALTFEEWFSSYGHCLLGLCQLPKSGLAVEMRKRIFTQHKKSQTAEYLRELGYSEKNLNEPIVQPIPSLKTGKRVDVSLDAALKDPTIVSYLNRVKRYFSPAIPEISRIDSMASVLYTDQDHTVHGSSYHISGSLHDVVTMIRRVNQEYQLSDQYRNGYLDRLESSISRKDNTYTAHIVVVAKPGHPVNIGEKMQGVQVSLPSHEVHPERMESRRRQETDIKRKEMKGNQMKDEKESHDPAIRESEVEKNGFQEYHGTGIAPAEKEEREAYHQTSIPPVEETLQPQIASWESESFDLAKYIGHDDWNVSIDDPDSISKKSATHFRKQRQKELHKRPDHRVTWDEIRRQRYSVSYKQAVKILILSSKNLDTSP